MLGTAVSGAAREINRFIRHGYLAYSGLPFS